jgi:lipopolysaccharide/colanic/teichoic acid biosynthesis glycosyltransferase
MPVAILAPFGSSKTEISGVPIVGKLDALERVTQEYKVNEILLCDGSEQMLNLLAFAEGRFLGFHVSPETLGVFRENISPEMLSGKTILTLQHSPLFGWGQFWKRGFDFLLALLSLGIVSPVFLVQKVFKGSEKLFQKEQRIGAGGRKFDMISYKRSDSIIRNLPNIFNILKGEMSFVGPRPALKEQWESLPPHFKRRMILRPGILGLWQLRKIRGQKDNFDQMYKDDMQYIHHWSFGQDMAIICMSLLEFIKKIFYKK